jgi:pilus assembly protein Flp/PilA
MTALLITIQSFITARLQGSDNERGATMVEYGLMVALIAVVVAVAAGALGTGIAGLFDEVTGDL